MFCFMRFFNPLCHVDTGGFIYKDHDFMNAIFLEKLIRYRSEFDIQVARELIKNKINFQFGSINKSTVIPKYCENLKRTDSIQGILLIEARAAKEYWKFFGKLVKDDSFRRKPHSSSVANILLDIGYHYLAGEVLKICQGQNIPTELGFLHRAQSSHAHPLIYDFMEWLRPVVVDKSVLKMLRQKKKVPTFIKKKDIGRLVNDIKKRFDKLYFYNSFGYCISLRYWTCLMFLNFESAVNTEIEFKPKLPSLRHETRCKNKTAKH